MSGSANTPLNKVELAGLEIDRKDVVLMWWLNTKRVVPRDDSNVRR